MTHQRIGFVNSEEGEDYTDEGKIKKGFRFLGIVGKRKDIIKGESGVGLGRSGGDAPSKGNACPVAFH